MENGKAKQLLDRIQDIVGDGQNVPFAAGKVLVNKEEVLEIVEELKTTIDLELKAYHEITDKRSKIIKEAEQEADEIIAEAEETASRIRLTKPSPLFVDRNVKSLGKQDRQALRTANEIYAASIIYTNEMLMEINETVNQAYNMISMESDRVLDSLRKKSEIIENNKKELMEGLMDMKKQERYADILRSASFWRMSCIMRRTKPRMRSTRIRTVSRRWFSGSSILKIRRSLNQSE